MARDGLTFASLSDELCRVACNSVSLHWPPFNLHDKKMIATSFSCFLAEQTFELSAKIREVGSVYIAKA